MKPRLAAIIVTVGVLALPGCAGSSHRSSGAHGRTLTLAVDDAVDDLDPASAFTGWFTNRDGITETLVDVDARLNLVPRLATAWKPVDRTTWMFTLRRGVLFHDGSPMDAAAVKASLEHARTTNVRAASQLPIASITARDHTLTIRTKRPMAALPHVLADPMTGIQALGRGIDPTRAPVATGPYKVTEFVPGRRRVLGAHTRYWAGRPALDRITVRTYGDTQAMGMAVQSGEADIVVRPDAAGLSAYSDPRRYRVWTTTSTRADGVVVNTTSPLLEDVRARRAVAHAIDRNAYVTLLHGKAEPSHGFFPDDVTFGGDDGLDVPARSKDLAATRKILLGLGYHDEDGRLVKGGRPLTITVLTYPKRPYLGALAQVLQSDLRGIGVTVKITELTDTTHAMEAGDFDLAMWSMAAAPTGDPEYFLDTMLRSGSRSNYSHWTSPRFDSALTDLSTTVDPRQRLAKVKKVENVAMQELPYITIGHQQWWAVSDADVKELSLRPTEYHLIDHRTHVD